jgi:DNA repair exonuclease SbcCD ATPase subunit
MTACLEGVAVVAIASSATCTLGLSGYSHVRLLREAVTNAEGGPLSNSPLASVREGGLGPLKAGEVELSLNDNTVGKVAVEFNGELLYYTNNGKTEPAAALGGMEVILQGQTVKALAKEQLTPSSVTIEFPDSQQAQSWFNGLRDASQRSAAHLRIQEFIEYVLELEKYIKALKDRAKKVKQLEDETEELKEKLKKLEDESPKKEKNGKRAHGKSESREDDEEEEEEGAGRKQAEYLPPVADRAVDPSDYSAVAKDLEAKASNLEKNLATFEERKRKNDEDQESEQDRLLQALSAAEKAVADANGKADNLEKRLYQLESGATNAKVQELRAAADDLEKRANELERSRPTSPESSPPASPQKSSSLEVGKLEKQMQEYDTMLANYVDRLGQVAVKQDQKVVAAYAPPTPESSPDPALVAKLNESERERQQLQAFAEGLTLQLNQEKAKNASASVEVVQDTAELTALRTELAMTQQKLQAKDAEANALITRAQADASGAIREVEALRQELATAVTPQAVESMKQQYEQALSNCVSINDVENMKAQFQEQLRQELANSVSAQELENTKQQYEQALSSSQMEIAKQQEERAMVEQSYVTVQAEANSYKEKIAGLEQALAEKDSLSPSQDPRVMMYKQEAVDAKAAVEQASLDISALKQKNNSLQDSQIQQNQTIVKLQNELNQALQAARSAPNEADIDSMRKDYESQLERMQRVHKDKEDQMMKEFETGFIDVRREVQEEKNRAEEVAARGEFLEQEKRNLQLQLEQLMQQQSDSSSTRDELRRYQKGAEEDRRTIEMLQTALSQQGADQAMALQSAQLKSEELQQQVLALSSDRQQLEAERDYLMKEMQKFEQQRPAENPASQMLVNELTAENMDLKNQLQQTWSKISDQTKKIEEEREVFWQELEAVRTAQQTKQAPANITIPGQTGTTTSTLGSPMMTQLRAGNSSLPANREVKYPASRGGPFETVSRGGPSFTTSATTAPRAVPVRESRNLGSSAVGGGVTMENVQYMEGRRPLGGGLGGLPGRGNPSLITRGALGQRS